LLRWHHGIDIMIPKKADSQRVDKLRTIVLMEADFNFINKIIGKRIMKNAETANNLAAEQYGSRKQMSSILHATNKQLTFDIVNSTKQNTALLILDAKSCYDRIAQPIASICLRRQGAPKSFCSVMFDTIDKMKHTIRTSYGDSEMHYLRENTRFHGILQGNGAGPAIWAAVSSPLLDRLKATGFGVPITSPGSRDTITIPAFAFVDDTDLIQHVADINNVAHLPQQALSQWEDNLTATGGALVSEKCNWFVLAHQWHNNNWRYLSEQETPGSVSLRNQDGSRTLIQRVNPSDAVQALGVMFSPSGNMKHQIEYMKQQATKWANTIRVCGLSRSHVWYSLNSMIMKSLEYPLLATTIAEKDLESIMSTILQVGLSRSGICRTITRKAVYSANKYFGFGIKHLHITQGLSKLHLFLQPKSDLTSHLITTAWECCRLQTGLGNNFFSTTITKNIRNYVSEGWMFTLWEFLQRYKISLQMITNETRRFDGDSFIMAKISNTNISKGDIRIFNFCRLYLQVELLSDILTADGKRIRPSIWKGERLIQCHRWKWPHQPRPDNKGWSIWKRILRITFETNAEGVLQSRKPTFRFSSEWKWFYSNSELRLYELHEGQFWFRSIVRQPGRQSRHRHSAFGQPVPTNTAPTDLQICTVYPRGQQMMLESTGLLGQRDTGDVTLPLWTSTIDLKQEGDDREFQDAWFSGQMMLVSDGSAKNGLATGAWIFTSLQLYEQGKYIEASAISPGPESSQDSHRAECIGLLGGLRMVQQKLHSWRVAEGHIVVACDNISALKFAVLRTTYKYIHSHIPDYDVLQACRSVMEPGVEYEYHHVRGHQDDLGRPLDIYETLNVRMDLLAKSRREEYENEHTQRHSKHMKLPNERWYLRAGDHKVCRHLNTNLYEHIPYQNISQYWNKEEENGGRPVASVDWETVCNESPPTTPPTLDLQTCFWGMRSE
jgi:Reverse transcriptase (RNA-dependent DNA polymerase)